MDAEGSIQVSLLHRVSTAQTLTEVTQAIAQMALECTSAHGVRLYLPEPGGDLQVFASSGHGFGLFETEEINFEVYVTRESQHFDQHAHLSFGKGDVWAVLEMIFPNNTSLELLDSLLGLLGFALEATFERETKELQFQQSHLLSNLTRVLGGSLDVEHIRRTLAQFSVHVLKMERSFIGLFERIEDNAAITGKLNTHGFGDTFKDQPLRLVSDSYVRLVQRREPIVVRSTLDHWMPLARSMSVHHNMQVCLVLPLITRERLLGVLYVDTTQVGSSLEGATIHQGKLLAEQAAIALDNALMYGEETRKRHAEEALREVSAALASSLHLSDILECILEESRRLFGAQAVAIFQLDPTENMMHIRSSVGLDAAFISNVGYRLKVGVVGQAVDQNRPILIPDMQEHYRKNPHTWGKNSYSRRLMEDQNYPFRGVLGLPLVARGTAFGGMALYFEAAIRELRDEDIHLLEVFAGQAALAIENARLFEELKEQELQYRILAESAQDLILTMDLRGRITYANPAAQSVLGYRPELLVGRSVTECLPNGVTSDMLAAWKSSLRARGKRGVWLEGQARARDGEMAYLEINLCALERDSKIIGVLAVARDLTEEHRLAEEIQSRRQDLRRAEERGIELRSYLALFTQAQEEERRRIARELHDDTAQVLVAIGRRIDRLVRGLAEEALRERALAIRDDVDAAIESVRRFSHNLRPSVLDDLGLISALEQLVDRALTPTSLQVSGMDRRLNADVELTVFRTVQECLTNIDKHAQASGARICVQFTGTQVEVSIADDGVGFEPRELSQLLREGHMGLLGLKERVELLGGKLNIDSSPGCGTQTWFILPDTQLTVQ